MTLVLELKGYTTLDHLDGDEDVLENFFEYSGSTYICDAITEIADNAVPIHNYDIWAGAQAIQEYIESAMEEGLASLDNGLDKVFMAGYYQYYTQLLYNNQDELLYNYVAQQVDEYLNGLPEADMEQLMSEIDIPARIEDDIDDFDHNKLFSSLDDYADAIIDELKEELAGHKEF